MSGRDLATSRTACVTGYAKLADTAKPAIGYCQKNRLATTIELCVPVSGAHHDEPSSHRQQLVS